MKMKINFLFILLLLTVVSCKEKENNSDSNVEKQEVAANAFKLTLNIIAKKKDNFCLLYTEDGSLNFNDGIWSQSKGSESEQAIEFALPKDVFPTQLRLDLGKNKEQEDLVIKSIKFEYQGKIRELKGAEMGVFFRADASKCSFDAITGVVKAIVKDGNREYSLYPNEAILAAELPKLAK